MGRRSGDVVEVLAPRRSGEPSGDAPRIGTLLGFRGGRPEVDFPGNPGDPSIARTMVPLGAHRGGARGAGPWEVVLIFDGGDPRRPIIAGMLEPETEPSALLGALLAPRAPGPGGPGPDTRFELEEDGRRMLLEARDEVVIRCGESSITLRRNGKVVIRGAYVETHATGTNRLKGGSVKIN